MGYILLYVVSSMPPPALMFIQQVYQLVLLFDGRVYSDGLVCWLI